MFANCSKFKVFLNKNIMIFLKQCLWLTLVKINVFLPDRFIKLYQNLSEVELKNF